MNAWVQTGENFAAYVTVCRDCGGEVQQLYAAPDGHTRILPCGHFAHLVVQPNPKLRPAS